MSDTSMLPDARPEGRRILIATIGSLGDLHPCLALALELMRRGHRVTIACAEFYRGRVEGLGVSFAPMRPHWDPTDGEQIRRCEDMKRGTEVLFRELVLPHLRPMYDDLLAAAAHADLMLAGEMVFAAPLVAEKLGLRWASVILSPCSFLSSHDPSVLPNVPFLFHVGTVSRRAYGAGMSLCRLALRSWWGPVRKLRREEGLRVACEPVFRDKFSPELVLALFSPVLARRQPDWPASTVQPGFVYFDRQSGPADTAAELEAFLAEGEAPIVFTQGSTAVHSAGSFYEVSARAARLLGRRALLLGARAGLNGPGVLALQYASYGSVFPRAAAIVHQGGAGTVGQAMRAGKPMLVVPYGWDQPDNGARVERLGIGLTLERRRYSAENAASALERLLGDPQVAAQAARVASLLRDEDGLVGACDALERVFAHSPALIPTVE